MSPRECLMKADVCDQMARDTSVRTNRSMLLEAAKHWRTLANTATEPKGNDGNGPDPTV